ncbi:MAG: FeoB-associated Cys-rich membrane protein [Lachnospiraceae bacterium]|nr:FeoB-associated Cys-rich membrane protein [Lachnospiraceae bacterium]
MLTWISQNFGTLIVIVILAAVVAAVIVKIVKDKRQGKSSCGHNCAHCAMAGMCHKVQKKKRRAAS